MLTTTAKPRRRLIPVLDRMRDVEITTQTGTLVHAVEMHGGVCLTLMGTKVPASCIREVRYL